MSQNRETDNNEANSFSQGSQQNGEQQLAKQMQSLNIQNNPIVEQQQKVQEYQELKQDKQEGSSNLVEIFHSKVECFASNIDQNRQQIQVNKCCPSFAPWLENFNQKQQKQSGQKIEHFQETTHKANEFQSYHQNNHQNAYYNLQYENLQKLRQQQIYQHQAALHQFGGNFGFSHCQMPMMPMHMPMQMGMGPNMYHQGYPLPHPHPSLNQFHYGYNCIQQHPFPNQFPQQPFQQPPYWQYPQFQTQIPQHQFKRYGQPECFVARNNMNQNQEQRQTERNQGLQGRGNKFGHFKNQKRKHHQGRQQSLKQQERSKDQHKHWKDAHRRYRGNRSSSSSSQSSSSSEQNFSQSKSKSKRHYKKKHQSKQHKNKQFSESDQGNDSNANFPIVSPQLKPYLDKMPKKLAYKTINFLTKRIKSQQQFEVFMSVLKQLQNQIPDFLNSFFNYHKIMKAIIKKNYDLQKIVAHLQKKADIKMKKIEHDNAFMNKFPNPAQIDYLQQKDLNRLDAQKALFLVDANNIMQKQKVFRKYFQSQEIADKAEGQIRLAWMFAQSNLKVQLFHDNYYPQHYQTTKQKLLSQLQIQILKAIPTHFADKSTHPPETADTKILQHLRKIATQPSQLQKYKQYTIIIVSADKQLLQLAYQIWPKIKQTSGKFIFKYCKKMIRDQYRTRPEMKGIIARIFMDKWKREERRRNRAHYDHNHDHDHWQEGRNRGRGRGKSKNQY